MRFPRSLVLAALASSLALGLLAAPASAQVDPRLALVNGIPGRTVDVCTGGAEVSSRLDYRDFVVRSFDPGSRHIRFRAAGPGTCTGEVLARTSLDLAADQDLAVVATKRAPMKVVVLEFVAPDAPEAGQLTFAYAGDLGKINAARNRQDIHDPFIAPASSAPRWRKGDKTLFAETTVTLRFLVFLPRATESFRESRWISVGPGERGWVIFVGSSEANARFVRIIVPNPAP